MKQLNAAKIAVVVPVFDRFESISRLIEVLAGQSDDVSFVIVDHGTSDYKPSLDVVERVEVVRRSPELWFTGALNEGLRHVLKHRDDVSDVLIVNDDITIEDDDWLRKLQSHLSSRTMVSCMAVDNQQRVLYAGLRFCRFRCQYLRLEQGSVASELTQVVYTCDALPTRTLLVRKEVIQEVGLLNAKALPHYASDYEWTARAKRYGIELLMITSTAVQTEMATRNKMGRTKIYPKPKLRNFWREALDPRVQGSFPNTFHLARLTQSLPYALYQTGMRLSAKIVGFICSNYLRSP